MSFDKQRSVWLRGILSPERLTHVVDVGANPVEDVPYKPLLDAGGCHVTGFEPQPEAFAKLQNIKGPNETYHQFAVGDGQTRDLYLTRHDTMTSFYKGYQPSCDYLGRFGPALEIKETLSLETRALDTAPEVQDFDLLKIDIQGGECIVFDGATERLKTAVAVIPEIRFIQLYEGEPMFAGVDADLRARGFVLHKFMFAKALALPTSAYKASNPGAFRNQLIDGDAVYIRDLSKPDVYSIEDLKHLAILADGVWFSFDLTMRCLDLLARQGAVPSGSAVSYLRKLPSKFHKQPTTSKGS